MSRHQWSKPLKLVIQYIPRNMHTVFALLCFVVVIYWLIFPYPSDLLHWHCGNLTIAPVPAKQPWWIWINTSCEFIMNDCITTTKQSTTKPCAYFLGYTVHHRVVAMVITWIVCARCNGLELNFKRALTLLRVTWNTICKIIHELPWISVWVTNGAIWQWFLVVKSRVKIIGKSLHERPKIVIHDNELSFYLLHTIYMLCTYNCAETVISRLFRQCHQGRSFLTSPQWSVT